MSSTLAPRRRDPRASSPGRFQRRVAVPETCSFYGTADAISACRVPRSCADCLARPGCMLTLTGACKEAGMRFGAYADARTLAAAHNDSSPGPIVRFDKVSQVPVFFAGNATYCGASDATCALCRREFEDMARDSKKTREALKDAFCVGADGRCVCTGVCEVPAYRASQVQDDQCHGPKLYYAAGHKVPGFSSRRRDPRAPFSSRMSKRESVDTCGFYDGLDVRGCRQPRLASDCLRRMGCMISQADGCVDAQYPATDLTKNSTIPLGFGLMPVRYVAGITSACALNDARCSSCASDIYLYSKGKGVDSFNVRCVGSGGCICDDFLSFHDKDWMGSKRDPDCPLPPPTDPDRIIIGVVIVFVMVLLLVGGCLRYAMVRNRIEEAAATVQEQAAHLMRHMIDNAPGGLDLDLFGWRRYQQTLQENEARLLRGEENVSPVARPMDLKEWLSPTAPVLEELEDATAPVRNDPMTLATAPMGGSMLDVFVEPPVDVQPVAPTAPDFDEDPLVAEAPAEGTRHRRATRHVAPIGD